VIWRLDVVVLAVDLGHLHLRPCCEVMISLVIGIKCIALSELSLFCCVLT
jgi:hypothetical protein